MNEEEFKARTKQLGLRVIMLCESLPRTRTPDIIARQLIRSATSVGANYRASCRGCSIEEIVAKLSIVEEECDETLYWLEILRDAKLVDSDRLWPLIGEANQILAMTVASKKTLKERIGRGGFADAGSNRKS